MMMYHVLLATIVLSLYSGPLSAAFSFNPKGMRGDCRFFLDTADESEWSNLLPLGIFHGVTTNPILLERAGHTCTVPEIQALARRALSQTQEFMCQAWGQDADSVYDVGMRISEPARDRIVVKVPLTEEGTKAARKLVQSGVRVCLTACYSSHQALIAAGTGAEYIAPYLGRMNENGLDGVEECRKMQELVDGLGSDTRILAASIRDVDNLVELAADGLDSITFSPDVARALFQDPLVDDAVTEFGRAVTRASANTGRDGSSRRRDKRRRSSRRSRTQDRRRLEPDDREEMDDLGDFEDRRESSDLREFQDRREMGNFRELEDRRDMEDIPEPNPIRRDPAYKDAREFYDGGPLLEDRDSFGFDLDKLKQTDGREKFKIGRKGTENRKSSRNMFQYISEENTAFDFNAVQAPSGTDKDRRAFDPRDLYVDARSFYGRDQDFDIRDGPRYQDPRNTHLDNRGYLRDARELYQDRGIGIPRERRNGRDESSLYRDPRELGQDPRDMYQDTETEYRRGGRNRKEDRSPYRDPSKMYDDRTGNRRGYGVGQGDRSSYRDLRDNYQDERSDYRRGYDDRREDRSLYRDPRDNYQDERSDYRRGYDGRREDRSPYRDPRGANDDRRDYRRDVREDRSPYTDPRDEYPNERSDYRRGYDNRRDGRSSYVDPRDVYPDERSDYSRGYDDRRDGRSSYVDPRDRYQEERSDYRRGPEPGRERSSQYRDPREETNYFKDADINRRSEPQGKFRVGKKRPGTQYRDPSERRVDDFDGYRGPESGSDSRPLYRDFYGDEAASDFKAADINRQTDRQGKFKVGSKTSRFDETTRGGGQSLSDIRRDREGPRNMYQDPSAPPPFDASNIRGGQKREGFNVGKGETKTSKEFRSLFQYPSQDETDAQYMDSLRRESESQRGPVARNGIGSGSYREPKVLFQDNSARGKLAKRGEKNVNKRDFRSLFQYPTVEETTAQYEASLRREAEVGNSLNKSPPRSTDGAGLGWNKAPDNGSLKGAPSKEFRSLFQYPSVEETTAKYEASLRRESEGTGNLDTKGAGNQSNDWLTDDQKNWLDTPTQRGL